MFQKSTVRYNIISKSKYSFFIFLPHPKSIYSLFSSSIQLLRSFIIRVEQFAPIADPNNPVKHVSKIFVLLFFFHVISFLSCLQAIIFNYFTQLLHVPYSIVCDKEPQISKRQCATNRNRKGKEKLRSSKKGREILFDY